jgi:hypothetical protein
MRGLCHICFSSGVELEVIRGVIMCSDCKSKKNAKN